MSGRTLVCWSGGGAPGICIGVGVRNALYARGIIPTDNSGTSAGACIAVFDSAGVSPVDLTSIIKTITDYDTREPRFAWKARMLWLESAYKSDRIRAKLRSLLPGSWSGVVKPCHCWATRMRDATLIDVANSQWTPGPADAVATSMAVPALWPAINLRGEDFVDGGVRMNVPMKPDWKLFDQVVVVVNQGREVDSYVGTEHILTRAIRALKYLMRDHILDAQELAAAMSDKVRFIWPNVRNDVGMTHMDYTLIDAAEKETYRILDSGEDRLVGKSLVRR
jgi:predicted acylesterase/phospholipase RssA